jgi:hypothetical protein
MTTSTATPSVLTTALDELGWRPEDLARRLNVLAAGQGRTERVHVKTPFKWLRGQEPRPPWPTLVAALLTEALSRTVTTANLGWKGDDIECLPATSGLILPWTATGTLQAVRVVTDAGPMDRRIFLTLLGAAVTPPALEWLIAHPADEVARAGATPLRGEVIDQVDLITAGLRRMDDHLGGGSLLGVVREHTRYVIDLIERRSYSDTIGRRLHASCGELLRLAGWLCFDAGQHAQAQRFWIAGLHAAHSAGDRALGANILGFMSCQAKDLGQYREAVNLAETARRGYPGATPKVAAILDLRAAEAYANDGASDACRAAIDDAFGRIGTDGASYGAPDWCYWLDEAQAHAQGGYCYVRLQDWPRARTHLRSALRLQDSQFSREAALRRVLLATTYVHQDQPDIDQAAALGTQAVQSLAGEVDSTRCVGHLARLADHLAAYRRNPTVRDFHDQAAELLAHAA